MPQPLEGLRVIDCSSILAGPMTATQLGDFGAEVIKIEHPERGDSIRAHGDHDAELLWKALSRNKKSVGIDLHATSGQEILHELVETADVFIENFRPGTLEQWNLGWETLSGINPSLVMVRVTGFGQTGPYKDRPGFGTLAESMSGFAQLTGQPDGPPTLPPFGLADAFSAMYSVGATMFALYWRDVQGGSGQYIDSTIFEPIFVALMHPHIIEHGETGEVRGRLGNRSNNVAPRNTYETKDGEWVAVSSSSESIAKRILKIVGGEELVNDPRFETMQSRVAHVEELDAIIQEWMRQHTREEIIDIFEANEAAIAPIYDIEDISADPHFQARDAIIDVADDELGSVSMHGVVPKLSETPGEVEHAGPALGANTREILNEYTSLSPEEITALAEEGVLAVDS